MDSTALLRYHVLSIGYSLQSFLSLADDPFYKYVRCNIIHETLDRVRFKPIAASIPDARSATGK